MNSEYLKGVLDAKISGLLTESDYLTFANLSNYEQLNFFINSNLVSTNIVTNFEALCKHALNDLKVEMTHYLKPDTLYIDYFFAKDVVAKESGVLGKHYTEMYLKAKARHDKWLVYYLDYKFATFNVLNIIRAKKRGDELSAINDIYLPTKVMSYEVFTSLVSGDHANLISYIKTTLNIDVTEKDDVTIIEQKLDKYLYLRVRDLAVETDVLATAVYYIKMKKYEITRLREIYYTRRIKSPWMN